MARARSEPAVGLDRKTTLDHHGSPTHRAVLPTRQVHSPHEPQIHPIVGLAEAATSLVEGVSHHGSRPGSENCDWMPSCLKGTLEFKDEYP